MRAGFGGSCSIRSSRIRTADKIKYSARREAWQTDGCKRRRAKRFRRRLWAAGLRGAIIAEVDIYSSTAEDCIRASKKAQIKRWLDTSAVKDWDAQEERATGTGRFVEAALKEKSRQDARHFARHHFFDRFDLCDERLLCPVLQRGGRMFSDCRNRAGLHQSSRGTCRGSWSRHPLAVPEVSGRKTQKRKSLAGPFRGENPQQRLPRTFCPELERRQPLTTARHEKDIVMKLSPWVVKDALLNTWEQ